MNRFLVLLLCATTPLASFAQRIDKEDIESTAIEISPTDVPKPLSKYYFQVKYSETKPGDKLTEFLKCFMEQNVFFNQENQTKRSEALQLPLDQLKPDDFITLKDGIAYDHQTLSMMVRLDQAARYNRVEWNDHFDIQKYGFYYTIPEAQSLRMLATVLHLRLRIEIKEKQFDRAIVTIRTMISLAQMLETHPTIIGNLIGLAIARITAKGMEELIAQPGCPNLYWSFADLPKPIISFRKGFEGERTFQKNISKMVPHDRALSEKEISDILDQFQMLSGLTGGNKTGEKVALLANYSILALNKKMLDDTRQQLKTEKISDDIVNGMSPLQLALIQDMYQFEVNQDEFLKWTNMPSPQTLKGLRQFETLLIEQRKKGWLITGLFLPAIRSVSESQLNTQQKFNMLMTVEAIRHYAHEHQNQLPTKLSDLSLVPPNDPVTGLPFEYSKNGDIATLKSSRLRKVEQFEIKIRK